ncbi:MAG: Rrf2 family transcriptional regulator [Fibrobacteres bacterium]|jgi:Rrf2 family iron-sulfur cluster assembly transcriptional regulator|nr:Rrf2 family transcriptional regulator [Fibrobacterota bacterium]
MISINLTQTAEYALRAMSSLALRSDQGPMRANELAESTAVPLAYLWKIMRRMVDAGLVVSAKGHGGGFRLARPAEAISYMDILGVVGYDAKAGSCVFGWGQCRSEKPCPMHPTWNKLNESFVDWARTTTLASFGPAASGAAPAGRSRKSQSLRPPAAEKPSR